MKKYLILALLFINTVTYWQLTLINAGTYVGIPFQGTNPDLGAYEYTNPPVFTNKGFLKNKTGTRFLKNKTGTKLLIINQ
jgi:hypothetical protein